MTDEEYNKWKADKFEGFQDYLGEFLEAIAVVLPVTLVALVVILGGAAWALNQWTSRTHR